MINLLSLSSNVSRETPKIPYQSVSFYQNCIVPRETIKCIQLDFLIITNELTIVPRETERGTLILYLYLLKLPNVSRETLKISKIS